MTAASIQKTIEKISKEINDAFVQDHNALSSIKMESARIEEIISRILETTFNELATNGERKKLYYQLSLKWHPDTCKQTDPLFTYLREKNLLDLPSKKLFSTYPLFSNRFDFSQTINLLKTALKKIIKMQVESDRYWRFFKTPLKYIVNNMYLITLIIATIIIIIPSLTLNYITSYFLSLGITALEHIDSLESDRQITQLLDWITQDKYSELRVPYENDETRHLLAREMYANEWIERLLYRSLPPSSWPNTVEESIELISKYQLQTTDFGPHHIEDEIKVKITQGVLCLKILLKAIYAALTTPLPTGVLPKIRSIFSRALLILITPLALALTAIIEGLIYLANHNALSRCLFAIAMPLSMALLGIINAPLYILDTCRFLKEKTYAAVRFVFKGKEEATNAPDLNTSHRTALLYLMGPQVIQVEAEKEVDDLYNSTDVYCDVEEDVEEDAANEVQNDVEPEEPARRCAIS